MSRHITVLLRNAPGEFNAIAARLQEEGIRILAFHAAAAGPRSGYIQMVCDDHLRALAVLSALYHNYAYDSEVLAIRLNQGPASLVDALSFLAEANVHIENAYQTYDRRGTPIVLVEVGAEDRDRTIDTLTSTAQIEILSSLSMEV